MIEVLWPTGDVYRGSTAEDVLTAARDAIDPYTDLPRFQIELARAVYAGSRGGKKLDPTEPPESFLRGLAMDSVVLILRWA